jgi:hypothetical protein
MECNGEISGINLLKDLDGGDFSTPLRYARNDESNGLILYGL